LPEAVFDESIISIVLPTRGRADLVHRLLESIVTTADRADRLELLLYLDNDDPSAHAIAHPGLRLLKLIRPPAKMGAMAQACYEASTGGYIMQLNDDVICRTRGWDTAVREAFSQFPDGVALVWCNDLFRGATMPNLPTVSRRLCEQIGCLCPVDYNRDYIDTHLFDIFKKLEALGHRRLVYLQEVVLEHLHYETGKAEFDRTYSRHRAAADELTFIAWEQQRQVIAEGLARYINGGAACDS